VGRGKLAVSVVALALALLVPSPGAAAGEPQLRLYAVEGLYTREERSLLASLGTDIAAVEPGRVIVVATEAEARELSLRGYVVVPVAEPEDFPRDDENYHNYAEMVADLEAVARAYPNRVHLFSIGTSYEGRSLIGARVSNDASDNLAEPGVFFVGQHHAREHLTVEVVLSLLHLFAESTDPEVRALVQSRQIYIVPSLNPDGSEYDLEGDQYHFWRKNRQPNEGSEFVGTDLNRNYSYKWGCCGGSSGNPGSETYRGPFAFSSPEDARLRDFVLAHPNLRTAISYHSYGSLILYPYGYTFEDVPPDMDPVDHEAFVAIAAEMARTTGYTDQQSSDLYITDGDLDDWMYGAQSVYQFTIELDGYGRGFYPPDEVIPQETERNHAAAIYVAKVADCPTAVVGVPCPELQTQSASEIVLRKGKRTAGNTGSLATDDADYFVVASTRNRRATSAWYGTFTGVPRLLSVLRADYKGRSEPACTQSIAFYNFRRDEWTTVQSAEIRVESLIRNVGPRGNLRDYVSGAGPSGSVRVRVQCTDTSTFTVGGNLLRLEFAS
jgi:hypothetical protein